MVFGMWQQKDSINSIQYYTSFCEIGFCEIGSNKNMVYLIKHWLWAARWRGKRGCGAGHRATARFPSCISNAPPVANDWHTGPGYTSSGWSTSFGVLSLVQFQKLISRLLLRISLNDMRLLCSSRTHLPSYEQARVSRFTLYIYIQDGPF